MVSLLWVVEELANLGGSEYLATTFGSLLVRAGVEVRIVAPAGVDRRWTDRLERAGVRIVYAPRGERSHTENLCRVAAEECRREPPSLIQFMPLGDSLVKWCEGEGLPTGFPVVGLEPTGLTARCWWLPPGLPEILQKVDGLIVLTPHAAAEARGRLEFRGPVWVVPNTVQPPAGMVEPCGKPVVTCISRFSQEKGVEVALLAFSHLLARRPDAELHLWGSGEDEERLRLLALLLGIEGRVKFRGTFEPVDGIDAGARGTGVAMLSSFFEGMPVVLLELAARGIPTVATRTSGAEAVLGEDYPWLGTIGDPEQLARLLAELLDDPSASARARETLLRRSSRFAPEVTVRSLLECYRALATPLRTARLHD